MCRQTPVTPSQRPSVATAALTDSMSTLTKSTVILFLSALVALRAALPGIPMPVVRLTASTATVQARLRRRDSGRELEEHLGEFEHYAELETAVPADVVVANDGRPLEEVAREILCQLQSFGWV